MAGGTHAFDMIKRMKANQNLKNFSYFKKQEQHTPKTSEPLTIDAQSWHDQKTQANSRAIDPLTLFRLLFKAIVTLVLAGMVMYLVLRLFN